MLVYIWMFINRSDSNLYDDRYYCTLHFDTSLINHDLDSRSRYCEKANTYLTKFSIGLNVGLLLLV